MYIDSPMHEGRELPTFSLRQIDLPEVMNWEVNGYYYLVMKVEMIGKHNNPDLPVKNEQDKLEGVFRMENVKAVGKLPVDARALEKQDFENTVADIKSKGV